MAANSKLAKEERRPPRARVDEELLGLLIDELEGVTDSKLPDFSRRWAQPHSFFYAAVFLVREQWPDGYRAVQYCRQRLDWELGLKERRPARGWGSIASYRRSGRFSDEECWDLNQLARATGDLFFALMREHDGKEPSAKRLLEGCSALEALPLLAQLKERAVSERRRAPARERVSTLAA